eukprot:COSAG01_NODE_11840_length_1849_cov_1.579429_2_plen_252_part_01
MRTRECTEAVAAFTAAALTPMATRSAEAGADVLQMEKSLDSIQEQIDNFDSWLGGIVAQHGSSQLLDRAQRCLQSPVKGYYKAKKSFGSDREDFLDVSAGDVIANIGIVENEGSAGGALCFGYRLAQPDVYGLFCSNYVEETEAPRHHIEGEPEPEPSTEPPTTQAARIGDGEPQGAATVLRHISRAEQSQTAEEGEGGDFPEQMDLFLREHPDLLLRRLRRGDVYDHMDKRRVHLIEEKRTEICEAFSPIF